MVEKLGLKHQPNKPKVLPTLETALRVAKDAFTGAAERDIYTGDYLEIYVIRTSGITMETFELRKD